MALTPEQFERLRELHQKRQSDMQKQSEPKSEQAGYLSRVGNDIKGNFNEAMASEKASIDGTMNPFRAGANIAKNVSGALAAPLAEAPGIRQMGEGFGKIGNAIVDSKIGNKATDFLAEHVSPEALGTTSDLLETGLNVATLEGTVRGTSNAASKIKGSLEQAAQDIYSKTKRLDNIPEAPKKILDFLSKEPDESVATILKETDPVKFDDFVRVAENAVKDRRNINPFELVGDNLAEATKGLAKKASEIGKQKSEYMNGLRNGFDPFDSTPFVQKLNSLKNAVSSASDKGVLQKFIEKAKSVKTKRAADSLIDEMQAELYKGNKDMTIPQGSSFDKQAKGLIGQFNNELKAVMPPEYAQLNARYSQINSAVRVLNKALGEKVEGVSTRGSSLVKQYFSPSGRTAKTLFEYIKKETGIDLAQDATLAKFVMELFDDPRAKSLLEGIPTSPRGLIEKGLDVVVDKTGLGKKYQETLRKGAIDKARSLTK